MQSYQHLLSALSAHKDEGYRQFNERIVNIPAGTSVGVRMPVLRAFGRAMVREKDFDLDALLAFPNEVYEVRLLKCIAVGSCKMPFAERMAYIDRCVPVIDGWAVCDLFCSVLKEVKKHRAEFFPKIEAYIEQGGEFPQRFAYVMLLGCYMERAYLPRIFSLLDRAETQYYYTHMGAAWLIAEILVRFYEEGTAYLRICGLNAATVNKAVQKARESFRLTAEQKKFLKLLKKG